MASPRMTEDEIRTYLADGHTGIFTTLRRDGMPIAMPMWYAVLDGLVYVQTRGRKLQRLRNDPRASFLVESGLRWAELRAVHLTGHCELIEDPDEELSRRFSEEFKRKYSSYRATELEMPKETAEYYATKLRGLVRFHPDERVLHWDNNKLGAS
ncbi:MAG: pyridoxamine 5'-phosphate oxidase family protein [Actinomycetota bacterium]|jgi:nitroimidazol reductase NimA-like FMN-containing flavoprotein (pyridoxamine 5'-phosphate oxidase superfamily)|nr:pyridoxamine 5'-phosphate oxidase family protein [Actinomycetota bacterium]